MEQYNVTKPKSAPRALNRDTPQNEIPEEGRKGDLKFPAPRVQDAVAVAVLCVCPCVSYFPNLRVYVKGFSDGLKGGVGMP